MLEWFEKIFSVKTQNEKISVHEGIDDLFDSLNETIIDVQVGDDLIPFCSDIIKVIWRLRDEVKAECGFIMPETRLRNNSSYQENEFRIHIHNKKVHQGFAVPTLTDSCDEIYEALKTVVYDNIDSIFTNELTEKYINAAMKNNSILIWNITNILSVIDIKTILSEIIMKGKSINNINYIFEKMGEYILADGISQSMCKKYNPHIISQAISKYLYK